MAEKKIAVIFAPLYLAIFILLVWNLPRSFSNNGRLATIAALLIFGFVTFAYVIMAAQWWPARRQKP